MCSTYPALFPKLIAVSVAFHTNPILVLSLTLILSLFFFFLKLCRSILKFHQLYFSLMLILILWNRLRVLSSPPFVTTNQPFSFCTVKPEWMPAFNILRLQDARGTAGITYLLISVLTCQKEPFSPLMHLYN